MERQLHTTHDKAETVQLGKDFAAQLSVGDVVALYGDLGAGKTEFVRGVCDFFHVGDIVSSPTFTIINSYSGDLEDDEEVKIYHVDLYRINSPDELADIGFDECLAAPDSIKLVEWAEKANGSLPRRRYTVIFRLDETDEDERFIEIRHTDETDSDDALLVPALTQYPAL
jgi:tRNA threonylcarbamoyladenosine biosynthesis protein TsaE